MVGNAGVDTNVYLDGDELDPGVEVHFTRTVDHAGQAGGFASRGYARLGYRTAFVGALGEDAAGEVVRVALARDGVDLRGSSSTRRGRRGASASSPGTDGGACSTTAKGT